MAWFDKRRKDGPTPPEDNSVTYEFSGVKVVAAPSEETYGVAKITISSDEEEKTRFVSKVINQRIRETGKASTMHSTATSNNCTRSFSFGEESNLAALTDRKPQLTFTDVTDVVTQVAREIPDVHTLATMMAVKEGADNVEHRKQQDLLARRDAVPYLEAVLKYCDKNFIPLSDDHRRGLAEALLTVTKRQRGV